MIQPSKIASAGRLALGALRVECEVDHHDGVFLHQADQHDDADEGQQVELHAKDHQREQRAEAGRRQSRENRDRMDEALVEHAQHQVDDQNRHHQQHSQVAHRGLERLARCPGRLVLTVAGSGVVGEPFHVVERLAKRDAGRDVERDGDRGQLARMVDRERPQGALQACATVLSGTSCPPLRAHVQQRRASRDRPDTAARLPGSPCIRRWARRWSRSAASRRRRRARLRSLAAETPSERALSRSISTLTCGLEICRSLLTSRQLAHRLHFAFQNRRVLVEFVGVGALQGELVGASVNCAPI